MTAGRPQEGQLRAVRSVAPVSAPLRFDQHEPRGVVVHLTRTEIEEAAETRLQRTVPSTLMEHIVQSTCGVPWLVELVLGAIQNDAGEGHLDPGISSEVVDRLGCELDTTYADLREFLLALAIGFDLSGRLPSVLDDVAAEIDELMSLARAAGLVLPDGRLVPLVHHAVLETTPAYRVSTLQLALADATLADELSTAARRAQAASELGDLDTATRIVDDLLAHQNAPDIARAVDVAACVWAQRGMLQNSAEMYRRYPPASGATSAAHATVCMVGVGDLEAAGAAPDETRTDGPPTLISVATSLMRQGLCESVRGNAAAALAALIRSSDMMTAACSAVPVPELPAVLAALVALHSGELGIADSVLERAIAGGQGGLASKPRLQLFRAWVSMQADHPDRAHLAIGQATEDVRSLAPRDALLYHALQVGLARRADDAPNLVRAWQRARESILHVQIDLYSLLPLGEMLLAATRLRDSAWLHAPLADAWALLAALGNPPLWSVPLHWSAAQAAILSDRPTELAPHAAALVRASAESSVATALAAAGRAWVAVRAGHFEVAAVEAAARGLASVGFTWDGSRLAGHAAARTDERRDMARLLACARSLHARTFATGPLSGAQPSTAPSARSEAGTVRDKSGLSAREREVAGLVLEGNTYEEIGEALFISPRTVEHHVARIRRQLGAATRSEMLIKLRDQLSAGDANP